MKAHVRSANNRVVIEVEAESCKSLFRQIAEAQEVFSADDACGCCNSTNLQFRCRTVDENDYYELMCMDCTARLRFGQSRKGGLFAKRKAEDGASLPNRGWEVWKAIPPAENKQVRRQ